MKEDILILKVIMFIILGLFSILLIATNVRINEFDNELTELRYNQINVVEE